MTSMTREELRSMQSGEARAPKAKRRDAETPVHKSILHYLRSVLPASHLVLHIPNAPRSKVAGAKLKSMGMMAGAPDLQILRPAARCAWVEVKAEGGRLSKEQRTFQAWCRDMGHPHCVARSIEDVRDWLEEENFPTKGASQ